MACRDGFAARVPSVKVGDPTAGASAARASRAFLVRDLLCRRRSPRFEGGAICYNIPYLQATISFAHFRSRRRQYASTVLTGLYFDQNGIVLDREYFGNASTGTAGPALPWRDRDPASRNRVARGPAGRAAASASAMPRQGTAFRTSRRSRTIKHAGGPRLIQERGGGVRACGMVNSIFCQYMAAFPAVAQPGRGSGSRSPRITAALSGATRMLTKTHRSRLQDSHAAGTTSSGLQLNMSGRQGGAGTAGGRCVMVRRGRGGGHHPAARCSRSSTP
jgi:hypothetical protein